jgi:hypothetical protein
MTKSKEIARANFNDALEMCDEIQRMSKLVGDPIAYIEADEDGTYNMVKLMERTLTDKSVVYEFVLLEE